MTDSSRTNRHVPPAPRGASCVLMFYICITANLFFGYARTPVSFKHSATPLRAERGVRRVAFINRGAAPRNSNSQLPMLQRPTSVRRRQTPVIGRRMGSNNIPEYDLRDERLMLTAPVSTNNEKHLAVVTGGGRGIGKYVAKNLGRMGFKVCVVNRSIGPAEETAKEINDLGIGEGVAYMADVSDKGQVNRVCEQIRTENQRDPVVLVNNAGITRDKLFLKMTDEEWDDVIRTNLDSSYYFTRNLIRGMARQKWGRIINMASVVGECRRARVHRDGDDERIDRRNQSNAQQPNTGTADGDPTRGGRLSRVPRL
eukprot:Selendium_serpulae@DN848_c0_g1_i2.p1